MPECLACSEPAEAPSLYCARCREAKAKARARKQKKDAAALSTRSKRR